MSKNNINKVFCALVCVALMACQQNAGKNETTVENQNDSTNEQVDAKSSKIVRKKLPFHGSFYQITNVGSTNIYFTQGDYAIEAEGPEYMIDYVKAVVDSGTLTIGIKDEEDIGINQFDHEKGTVNVYISCPELRILAMCSTGSFFCDGTITTSEMAMGTLSSGNIHIDKLVCNGSFRYDGSNIGKCRINNLMVDENAQIYLSEEASLIVKGDFDDDLFCDLAGNASLRLFGNGDDVNVAAFNKSKVFVNMNIDDFTASVVDNSYLRLGGNVDEKKVQKGRNATVEYGELQKIEDLVQE